MSALNNVDTGAFCHESCHEGGSGRTDYEAACWTGIYAHMSLKDIRHEITDQLNECSLDPFTYRDHGGESVGDLVRVRLLLGLYPSHLLVR